MGVKDESVRITLRLPESLRNSLLISARSNRRSMNSEIVSLLESTQSQHSGEANNLIETLLKNSRQLSGDSVSLLVELSRRLRP